MKIKRLTLWVLPVFVLDQATKLAIVKELPLGGKITIIPHFFDIVHVTNPGAAFGFLADLPASYRFWILTAVSVIAIGLITYYYMCLSGDRVRVQIPLAMILGGAAGNLFDRFFRGEVVDFLSFHWYDEWFWWNIWGFHGRVKLEWPSFNVADSAISIAVIWLLILMIREKKFL